MRISLSTITGALFVCAASVNAGSHMANHAKRHHDLAAREAQPERFEFRLGNFTNATDVDLQKRQNDARFTFYDVGLGACGITNTADQYIVALNQAQYGDGYPGPQCFKWITISYNGKQTSAQITDLCPTCPYRGLDLSRGLFNFFASEDAGVIYGNWWFNDGNGGGHGGGGGQQTTSSSSSPEWTPPTSTWQPPPSTSSSEWTPPPTTTWSSSSSEWTSSSSWSSSSDWSSSSSWSSSSEWSSPAEPTSTFNASSGVVPGLAVPIGALTVPAEGAQNIYELNLAIIELGALINAGAQLN